MNKLKRKPILAVLIVASILITGGLVWAGFYFNWFAKDRFANGPVILQPNSQPKPASIPYKIETFASDLNIPWSMVFTGPNRMLVSERNGFIRIIENGQLKPESLTNLESIVSSRSEEGLMGLAIDPDYSSNKLVYACYARASGNNLVDEVIRFEDRGDSIGPATTIIDNIPAAQYHAGCRLGFGPDQKLYVTTGDATDRNIAQQKNSLGGKILRINTDGSIPSDNPFAGSPIWSLGHRNPQGIAWQPKTGQLFSTEHGPSGFDGAGGGDEVNIITKGGNYGWPAVSHERTDSRYISPLLVFTPAVAPSGMTFYASDTLPQFTSNLFFTGLRGEGLYRVVLNEDKPSQVVSYEKMKDVQVGRIRDVITGPDGAIYFATSNRDGRGTPKPGDDKIYRLVPQK